jgi:uncharacterized membrane protein YozB (DUF420 family)
MQVLAQMSDWIMIVGGLLTATMVQAAIAPRSTLRSMFGEELTGPLAEIVVRNWGVLITLIGLMLIFGGATTSHRSLILAVAIASKLAFILLVLTLGRGYLRRPVGAALGVDALMVLLFALILMISS